jgi:hypothetical protein
MFFSYCTLAATCACFFRPAGVGEGIIKFKKDCYCSRWPGKCRAVCLLCWLSFWSFHRRYRILTKSNIKKGLLYFVTDSFTSTRGSVYLLLCRYYVSVPFQAKHYCGIHDLTSRCPSGQVWSAQSLRGPGSGLRGGRAGWRPHQQFHSLAGPPLYPRRHFYRHDHRPLYTSGMASHNTQSPTFLYSIRQRVLFLYI